MVPRGWASSDQFSSNSRSVNLFPLNRRENKEYTSFSSSVIHLCNVYKIVRENFNDIYMIIREEKKKEKEKKKVKRKKKVNLKRKTTCLSIIEIEKCSTCLLFAKMAAVASMAMLWGSGALGHFVISTPVCRAQEGGQTLQEVVSLSREHFERGVSFYSRQKCCISNLINII